MHGPNEQEPSVPTVQKAIYCIGTETRGFEVFRCLFMWRGGEGRRAVGKGRLPAGGGGQLQEEARQTNARKEGCLWAQGERVQSPIISNLIRSPLVSVGCSRFKFVNFYYKYYSVLRKNVFSAV